VGKKDWASNIQRIKDKKENNPKWRENLPDEARIFAAASPGAARHPLPQSIGGEGTASGGVSFVSSTLDCARQKADDTAAFAANVKKRGISPPLKETSKAGFSF
jgi:hypothetical protein